MIFFIFPPLFLFFSKCELLQNDCFLHILVYFQEWFFCCCQFYVISTVWIQLRCQAIQFPPKRTIQEFQWLWGADQWREDYLTQVSSCCVALWIHPQHPGLAHLGDSRQNTPLAPHAVLPMEFQTKLGPQNLRVQQKHYEANTTRIMIIG